jgi:putative holliday junction resolvase
MKRLAGIDFGKARIGVSLSDPLQLIASPLATLPHLKNLEETASSLLDFLVKHMPLEALILGLPLLLNGKDSEMTLSVREFSNHLKKIASFPIILWDERLTTQQTDRHFRDLGVNRKKRSQLLDSHSAALILQHYLDSQKVNSSLS